MPDFLHLLLELAHFVADQGSPLVVLRLHEVFFFVAELGDPGLEHRKFAGPDIALDFLHRARFVKHVDRLVGKKTVGKIASRKIDDGLERLVGIGNVVMLLVTAA